MALEIDLSIFTDSSRTEKTDSLRLYFGKALPSKWAGWEWVEMNGMSVDSPGTLDKSNAERGYVVTKDTLTKWIHDGFLSPDPWKEDKSAHFLTDFPVTAVFVLTFLDWS